MAIIERREQHVSHAAYFVLSLLLAAYNETTAFVENFSHRSVTLRIE